MFGRFFGYLAFTSPSFLLCFGGRRNEGANGGAIINGGGFIKFAAADLVSMTDNVALETVSRSGHFFA